MLLKNLCSKLVFEDLVRVLELLVIWMSIIITLCLLKDIIQGTSFLFEWICFLLIIIGALYTLLVVKEFTDKNIKLNRIVVLFYLIIFCFGLFAGLVVFKNNQSLPIIPKLQEGTVVFRSFGCGATFRNIEIYYMNSSNIWQKIPAEVVNDSAN